MNRLEGKKAIVTAAGAGIGRATALLFAAVTSNVLSIRLISCQSSSSSSLERKPVNRPIAA